MDESNNPYEQNQQRLLKERAEEINAGIIPDISDYVRTEGPRRQYVSEIRNGELHLTEL